MAKTLKYKNKVTGKDYEGSSQDVANIKANKLISNNYVFEAEVAEPAEPKSKTAAPTV